VRVLEISDEGVIYTDRDGARSATPVDTVILAGGAAENRGLAEELEGLGAEIHLLGDCRGVGYIEGAMMDAARIARAI
jgi:hypothetical protein